MSSSSLVPEHQLAIPVYRPAAIPERILQKFKSQGFVHLESNENPFGASPRVLEAINWSAKRVHRYPDSSLQRLRAALSNETGMEPDWIHLGSGIEEILGHISKAFVAPGDEIVLSSGTFPIYTNNNQFQQAKEVFVDLRDYHYDLPAIKDRITAKTKLVFLCNPNNPTGTAFDTEEFESFLQGLSPDLVLIMDEAYFEFTDQSRIPNSVEYFAKVSNLIVLRTFSKAYSLASLRIGYSIQRPELTHHLLRAQPLYSVNGFVEEAALAALEDQQHLRTCVQTILQQRTQMEGELKNRGLSVCPSEANFLCFLTHMDARELCAQLQEHGVLVCPLGAFGIPNGIRVTIGTPEENRRFLEAMDAVLH